MHGDMNYIFAVKYGISATDRREKLECSHRRAGFVFVRKWESCGDIITCQTVFTLCIQSTPFLDTWEGQQ